MSLLGAFVRQGLMGLGLTWCIACGKAPKSPEAEAAPDGIKEHYLAVSDRLTDVFLENGWVVSRHVDGSPEHMGEGLLWTGLAMYALPCAKGAPLEAMLIDMMERHGGQLVRYEPLGEYAGGREVTLDGALGLYLGIAERARRCGTGHLWASVVGEHHDYVFAHGRRLHENTDPALRGDFGFLLDALAHRLGRADAPNASSQGTLELEVAGWAATVNASHAAAYRVHLGYLVLMTIEALGYPVSGNGKNAFCSATRGVDIPLVDHYCGRADLKEWIARFRFDEWEYRFQRSGSWESPDGNGLKTPALDLLVALRTAYTLSP